MGETSLKIDSGAIDTCMPPTVAGAFPLRESAMSKAKAGYRAANGTPIRNHGEREIRGWTNEWSPFALTAQIADVRTALGSVYHMCRSGNRLIFDDDGSYIEINMRK